MDSGITTVFPGSGYLSGETNLRRCAVQQKTVEFDAIAINEAQLILAEKRTSLAVLRTGIAVFALPLSVLSVLIATSKYYDFVHVLKFLVPLFVLNLILVILGGYLIVRSILRMHHYDLLIKQIKKNTAPSPNLSNKMKKTA